MIETQVMTLSDGTSVDVCIITDDELGATRITAVGAPPGAWIQTVDEKYVVYTSDYILEDTMMMSSRISSSVPFNTLQEALEAMRIPK